MIKQESHGKCLSDHILCMQTKRLAKFGNLMKTEMKNMLPLITMYLHNKKLTLNIGNTIPLNKDGKCSPTLEMELKGGVNLFHPMKL